MKRSRYFQGLLPTLLVTSFVMVFSSGAIAAAPKYPGAPAGAAAGTNGPGLWIYPFKIDFPTWTKPGVQLDTTIRLTNNGDANLEIYAINIIRLTGVQYDWLGIGTFPGFIPYQEPNFFDLDIFLNKGGAVTTGPHGYDGLLEFLTGAPSSPDTFFIHLVIADTVQSPETADIRTACNRLIINNAGNLANKGISGYTFDFFDDCDTTDNLPGRDDNARIYLYDASPFVLRVIPGDTVLNSSIFNANWLQNDGFKPVTALTIDSSNPEYQYALSEFMTRDSAIGIRCEYWTPLHPDTCGFMVQRIRFNNRTMSNINNVRLGELMDWDIPSDSGVENQSGRIPGEQMIYQRGYEYAPDSIENNDCILADQRVGGFGYINGFKLPYTGGGDRYGDIAARGGMMTLLNADWCFPAGNFVPSQLWIKTTGFTGYETWQSTQPTMEDSIAQDLVMVAYFGGFNLGVNDTLVFVKMLAATKNGLSDLTASLAKAKAWIGGHLNNAPVLLPIGNKSGSAASTLTFTASAYDVDGENLIFSGENLPEGSSIDPVTGVFNWPGGRYPGVFTNIIIRVSDGRETDQEAITITLTGCCCWRPGDFNGNGAVNIQDVTATINYLYVRPGLNPPLNMYHADVNADCAINIQDITYLINYLYKQPGKPAPKCADCCPGWW